MKATKTKMTITVEVLNIDSIPGLLFDAIKCLKEEADQGVLRKDDGDEIFWSTTRKEVEF